MARSCSRAAEISLARRNVDVAVHAATGTQFNRLFQRRAADSRAGTRCVARHHAMKWKALLTPRGPCVPDLFSPFFSWRFFSLLCLGQANPPRKCLGRAKCHAARRLSPGRSSTVTCSVARPRRPCLDLGAVDQGHRSNSLREKQFPLWNPYNAYGTPFAAAMQPQPFFPAHCSTVRHPTPWTYNIFIIARLFLAGILTFLFARLFLDHTASLFASIAFMLNGYFIIFLNMPHLSVEVLLPALFLTFELLLRKTSWPAVVAAAVTICLCIIGGMPESSFLIISFACLYVLFRLLAITETERQLSSRAGRVRSLLAGIRPFSLSVASVCRIHASRP